MIAPRDIVGEFARRERSARRGLLIGGLTFLLALAGSYFLSRLDSLSWAPLVSTANLLFVVTSPIALGIGIANLSTSDKLAPRILYGVITGVIVLLALVIIAFQAYAAGGGKLHI